MTVLACVVAIAAGASVAATRTAASNRAAAEAAVGRLLAGVPIPPGAIRSSRNPSVGIWLDGPALGAPATPNLVGVHRFWRVPKAGRGVRVDPRAPARGRHVVGHRLRRPVRPPA